MVVPAGQGRARSGRNAPRKANGPEVERRLRADAVRKQEEMIMKEICALIVDDSSVMRKIVQRSLHQAGLEVGQVLEACDGWEALALAERNRVDLILCDINMPAMNGLEFLRMLRSVDSAKGTAVVMITTEGSEPSAAEAFALGARAYIRKPFTPEQIRQAVTPLLEA